MPRRNTVLAAGAGFLVGAVYMVSYGVVNHPQPDVEFIRVPGATKIVEVESEPVVTTVTPDSCILLGRLARSVSKGAGGYETVASEQLIITSDARVALADRDIAAFNDIERRQRDLVGQTRGAVIQLANAQARLQETLEACRSASSGR